MIIQHNLTAMNANRMMGLTKTRKAKTTEKLSSGYRINRSADDAAGLAISEKMRRQIRGLTQASYNCQDGVSLCQIADGALNEVHEMLKRCEELTIKAANGTNTNDEREYIQKELDAITAEIDRVQTTTVFNEMKIFSGFGVSPSNKADNINSISLYTDNGIRIEVGFVDAGGNRVDSPADIQATGKENSTEISESNLAKFSQKAALNAVSKLTSLYPSLFEAASTDGINVGLQLSTIDGSGSIAATASLSISSQNDNTMMSFRLHIDTSDYSISGFDDYSEDKKNELAAVIAHEMTHLMMFDTVTDGMLKGNVSSFPTWFVEGMAQTSSGDTGWLSYSLNASSSDAQIKNYMSQLSTMPYGAGYLAALYLGMSASGAEITDVTSTNIAKGLDKLLTKIAKGSTLGEAIAEVTDNKFTSLSNFQSVFSNSTGDSLDFVKAYLNARGDNGAGSILYNLNTSLSDAFNESSFVDTGSTYKVNRDSTWYSNAFGVGYDWPEMGSADDGSGFIIQAGSEAGQEIHINQYDISSYALFGGQRINVVGESHLSGDPYTTNGYTITHNSNDLISNTLRLIEMADEKISKVRAYYGATQNRLEHTINNLNNVVENTTDAESHIRDTDMVTMMMQYARDNILEQAGQTILAQANQSKQGILTLLQG